MTLWRCLLAAAATSAIAVQSPAEDLTLSLRYQQQTSLDSGRYHRLHRREQWNPHETAIIVCDVWDLHHCLNAVRRVEELVPRLNQVLAEARRRGVTIIHAPSDCMPAYADHPARRRAVEVPPAADLPEGIRSWCSRIPSEERAVYPIDQSDGGEDDDPDEHARWAARLESLGRDPKRPWKQQADLLAIDSRRDYISDRGDEVWNILQQRGVNNVILAGVHTNMCVLGRPFGLRQMANNGKNVVLMRDMTDTMYNPARWPYVSHFTGTDLIVDHIERHVCPTITSDQFLGGRPFRFREDARPHVAIVLAEEGYDTGRTLPQFALKHLGRHYRVSLVHGSDDHREGIAALEVLDEADLLLLSVRRRPLPPGQMAVLRRFVAAGKPVVGIRTASHAFALAKGSPPKGLVAWPEFDREVFGGNYQGDLGGKLKSTLQVVPEAAAHPILRGFPRQPIPQASSLYRTAPLATGTEVLLTGSVDAQSVEPVAWTFQRADGGRSFYTSLGSPADLDNPACARLLAAGIHWACGLDQVLDAMASEQAAAEADWRLLRVPVSAMPACSDVPTDGPRVVWYRCTVRIPQAWLDGQALALLLPSTDNRAHVWLNGHRLTPAGDARAGASARLTIRPEWIEPDDANLLVLRTFQGSAAVCLAPALVAGSRRLELAGRWQSREGDSPSWSHMPLPARYGASPDILIEP